MRFDVKQTPRNDGHVDTRNRAGASKAGGESKQEVGIGFDFKRRSTMRTTTPSNGRLYDLMSGRGGHLPVVPLVGVGFGVGFGVGIGRLLVPGLPFVDVVKSSLVPISVRTPKKFPLAEAARVANPLVDGAVVDQHFLRRGEEDGREMGRGRWEGYEEMGRGRWEGDGEMKMQRRWGDEDGKEMGRG